MHGRHDVAQLAVPVLSLEQRSEQGTPAQAGGDEAPAHLPPSPSPHCPTAWPASRASLTPHHPARTRIFPGGPRQPSRPSGPRGTAKLWFPILPVPRASGDSFCTGPEGHEERGRAPGPASLVPRPYSPPHRGCCSPQGDPWLKGSFRRPGCHRVPVAVQRRNIWRAPGTGCHRLPRPSPRAKPCSPSSPSSLPQEAVNQLSS